LVDNLKKEGHEVIELDPNIDLLRTILPVYRTISSVEAFSTNSNLTGFLFGECFDKASGNYEEKITQARTEGFGYEVKKRFLFAQEAIINNKKIYLKSMKLRRLIREEIERQLDEVDALLNIAAPNIAHKIEKFYKGDLLANTYLTIFNATGSPSLTVPDIQEGKMPVGFNIVTKQFKDLECLQYSKIVEENIE
jgi:aspartyl-tRNA(Asn)/glutamyl-tRNA(Gln) amidotransferase subunit A